MGRYIRDIEILSKSKEEFIKLFNDNISFKLIGDTFNVNEYAAIQYAKDLLLARKRKYGPRPTGKYLSIKKCETCGNLCKSKYTRFCCIKCSVTDFTSERKSEFLRRWLNGEDIGYTKYGNQISAIREYLFQKFESRCQKCGWSERNISTGRVPLEVDHKDGDWKNNRFDNLQLLCPNCHSLTPTFRSLNRGKGRGYKFVKRSIE